jgi:hypothetical protein
MYGLESPAGIEGYTQSFEQLTLEMQSLPTLELIDREGETVLSFVHLIDSARMAEVASVLFSFLLEYAYEKESAQKAIAGGIKIN